MLEPVLSLILVGGDPGLDELDELMLGKLAHGFFSLYNRGFILPNPLEIASKPVCLAK